MRYLKNTDTKNQIKTADLKPMLKEYGFNLLWVAEEIDLDLRVTILSIIDRRLPLL